MNTNLKDVPDKTFICDCHNREHIIMATHSSDDEFDEVYLSFMVNASDDVADRYRWSKSSWRLAWIDITNFFRRKWWRVKIALKVLFIGYVEMEDSWTPARLGYDDTDGLTFGYTELQNFVDWLQEALMTSKKNDAVRLAEFKKKVKNK